MRLFFKKGKQRELLQEEKEKRNLTWNRFASVLGIKTSKLKTFFNEERLIDYITFNKLEIKKEYEKDIIKRLKDNWGQSKGGRNSIGRTKNIKIPERSEALAELWGIILGDGSIQKIKAYRVGVYNIDVAGHSLNDKDYLINFVKPLFEKLFEVKARVYKSKFNQGLHVIVDSKMMVDFFENNEFKAGNKIINQVTIPNWIKENPLFLAACLRGLYDTDGSFYKLTNQNSCQIHFKNLNTTLLEDLRRGLIELGINPSKIICNKSVVITKKSEIKKFYKLIGFSNPKHLSKIRKFLAP